MDGKKENSPRSEKAVLIYDGTCALCTNTISWIREEEQENSFEMLPCQSDERKERYPSLGEDVCMQAMQLVLPDGNILAGEQALPEIFRRLRRYRSLSFLFKLPGAQTLSRIFYRWFAARRYLLATLLFPGKAHKHDRRP